MTILKNKKFWTFCLVALSFNLIPAMALADGKTPPPAPPAGKPAADIPGKPITPDGSQAPAAASSQSSQLTLDDLQSSNGIFKYEAITQDPSNPNAYTLSLRTFKDCFTSAGTGSAMGFHVDATPSSGTSTDDATGTAYVGFRVVDPVGPNGGVLRSCVAKHPSDCSEDDNSSDACTTMKYTITVPSTVSAHIGLVRKNANTGKNEWTQLVDSKSSNPLVHKSTQEVAADQAKANAEAMAKIKAKDMAIVTNCVPKNADDITTISAALSELNQDQLIPYATYQADLTRLQNKDIALTMASFAKRISDPSETQDSLGDLKDQMDSFDSEKFDDSTPLKTRQALLSDYENLAMRYAGDKVPMKSKDFATATDIIDGIPADLVSSDPTQVAQLTQNLDKNKLVYEGMTGDKNFTSDYQAEVQSVGNNMNADCMGSQGIQAAACQTDLQAYSALQQVPQLMQQQYQQQYMTQMQLQRTLAGVGAGGAGTAGANGSYLPSFLQNQSSGIPSNTGFGFGGGSSTYSPFATMMGYNQSGAYAPYNTMMGGSSTGINPLMMNGGVSPMSFGGSGISGF